MCSADFQAHGRPISRETDAPDNMPHGLLHINQYGAADWHPKATLLQLVLPHSLPSPSWPMLLDARFIQTLLAA